MKKILSMLLAASMLLAIAPMTVFAYDEGKIESIEADLKKSDNLAYGKTVIHSEKALDQGDGGAWRPIYLTDGSLNYNSSTHETTGYHSQHNAFGGNADKNHEEWVGVDFGTETEVDTLVLYPNRPQDSDFENTDGKCPSFPNAFRVQASNNNEDWATLTITVNGDDKGAAETIYNFDPPTPDPVKINFPAVKARYIRFVGVSLNWLAEGFYLKLSEMTAYNTGFVPGQYTYYENVAAKKPIKVTAGGAHDDATSNWHLVNLNNGDRYDMVTFGGNNDYGQFAGFHTMPEKQEKFSAVIELGEGTTLNQIVLIPSSEKFSGTAHLGSADKFYMPSDFTFEVSDDETEWTTVVEKTGYTVTKYEPQVFNLDDVYTAKFLRFTMPNLTSYIKISELEAYDTTKPLTANNPEDLKPADPVVKEGENLALGATLMASGVINSDNWNQANLNNGVIEDDGGFTTTEGTVDTAFTVGFDLGTLYRLNTLSLCSSGSTAEADANWSGIPKRFKIQVSTDQMNWVTVKEVINNTVPEKLKTHTYVFDTVNARYVRIQAVENYPKGSDGNKSYVQLAEMQVQYTVTHDELKGYVQFRPGDGVYDARLLVEGKSDFMEDYTSATVTLTFTKNDDSGKTKTMTAPADKAYTSVMACGQKKDARPGYGFIGLVVTGIGNNDVGSISASVTLTTADGDTFTYELGSVDNVPDYVGHPIA